jgi:hypothetical protein
MLNRPIEHQPVDSVKLVSVAAAKNAEVTIVLACVRESS